MITGAEIALGLNGIKTVLESLKTAKDLGGGAAAIPLHEVQAALIDAQRGLMAADQAHAADIDRIGQLEKEVAHFKTWNANEKERYELKNVDTGAMVFSLKKDCAAGEPAHWLCANCFQQGKKGFMQPQKPNAVSHFGSYKCGICGEGFRTHVGTYPAF